MKKGNIYIVIWEDTYQEVGWHSLEDIAEISKENLKEYIKSVGIYVGDYGKFVVLASEFNTNERMKNWSGITWIPRGCIRKITKIK